MHTEYKIYSDGGARPNPGKGISLIKVEPEDFIPCHEYRTYDHITNNQAEYQAFIMALEKGQRILSSLTYKPKLNFFVDSQLITGHLLKQWRVTTNHQLVNKAKQLFNKLKTQTQVSLNYIPRDKNIAGKLIEEMQGR